MIALNKVAIQMKPNIQFQLISPSDDESIQLIANWYLSEWNIPIQTTIDKIKRLSVDNHEFQVLMTLNNEPIATGGLYNHVGILNYEPRLKMYKNWLALVYTRPEFRGRGFGADLCNHIQDYSKSLGLKDLYLFTHTAENLYRRLGWEVMERVALGERNVVVMKKEL